jgi:hypothetical protein
MRVGTNVASYIQKNRGNPRVDSRGFVLCNTRRNHMLQRLGRPGISAREEDNCGFRMGDEATTCPMGAHRAEDECCPKVEHGR